MWIYDVPILFFSILYSSPRQSWCIVQPFSLVAGQEKWISINLLPNISAPIWKRFKSNSDWIIDVWNWNHCHYPKAFPASDYPVLQAFVMATCVHGRKLFIRNLILIQNFVNIRQWHNIRQRFGKLFGHYVNETELIPFNRATKGWRLKIELLGDRIVCAMLAYQFCYPC